MKRNKLMLVALLMLPQILFSNFSYGQMQMVKGKVTDENNSPIVGVNVIIQGTTNVTTTNKNGDYQIETSKESTLTFSFVGYDRKEKQVGNLSIINVTLIEDNTELADVIVVGYGTQRRQVGNKSGKLN